MLLLLDTPSGEIKRNHNDEKQTGRGNNRRSN